MNVLKQYGGQVLMAIGAVLLLVCRVTGWQSNTELVTGLLFVILGYMAFLWLQKHDEKY